MISTSSKGLNFQIILYLTIEGIFLYIVCMANNVISWAANVNQRIIDQTTMSIGENGFVEDSADNGMFSERRLTSLVSPDTYNVVMDFDWLTKINNSGEEDPNGKSEFERFVEWFKYVHKRGTIPFEFPSISRFNINGSTKMCRYVITSGLSPQKSGYSFRVSMTWKEVFTGGITITSRQTEPDSIVKCENGLVVVSYTSGISTLPTKEEAVIKVKIDGATTETTQATQLIKQDGKKLLIYFDTTDLASGRYLLSIELPSTNSTTKLLTEYFSV